MKTKITFKIEGETYVGVYRDGNQIGHIYSQADSAITETDGLPYPHIDGEYCKNSIQICGFDKISEIWNCGPFSGKKDCVVHFRPTSDEYYQKKAEKYAEYVKGFFKTEDHKIITGMGELQFPIIEKRLDKDIKDMLSFEAWLHRNAF